MCCSVFKTIIVGFLTVVLTSSNDVWPCQNNNDCVDGATCTNSVCSCPPGMQMVDNGRRCAAVAPYHTSTCIEDFQCSRLFTAFECHREGGLTEGTCRCIAGYHYFRGRCWETRQLGESCSRNEECQSSVLNNPFAFDCLNGICTCSEGYYLRQRGECRRIGYAVGDGCVLDIDCQFANGVCDLDTYTCYDNSVPPTRKNTTISKSNRQTNFEKQHGGLCASDLECGDPFICSQSLDICICPLGHYANPSGDGCWAEIGSTASEETCQGLFKVLENGVCVCQANLYADYNLHDCVKATTQFSHSCLSDASCHTFGAASYCGEPGEWGLRYCQCVTEEAVMQADNQMCRLFSGVGEICDDDSYCLAGNVEIECRLDSEGLRRCLCPDNLEPVGNLCLTTGLGLGQPCQVSQECSGTANSVCSEDGVCDCDTFFHESNATCSPVVGGPCALDSDCVIDNTICFEDGDEATCQCGQGYVAYEEQCWSIAEGYNSTCTDTVQCRTALGDGALCHDDFCVCASTHHYNDDYCWPITGLFQPCSRRSECYLGEHSERVVCRNGYCECDFQFPYLPELDTCGSASKIFSGLLTVILTATFMFFN